MESISNMQKYENYREQIGRLKRALTQGFNLEAVFIEYAMMEDRLESVLRHTGVWKEPGPGDSYPSIYNKIKRVRKLMENKKGLAGKYFTEELLERILLWKDQRNQFIHRMMCKSFGAEELIGIAQEGLELVKALSNQVRNYNRALDRQEKKKAEQRARA